MPRRTKPISPCYMGIDLSLRGTGVIIIQGDSIVEQALIKTTPKELIEDRIIHIGKEIRRIWAKYTISGINIEGLAFGARGQRMFELSGLHYHIRIRFANRKIDFMVTPPTTVKKWITGKGNANKEVMLMKVFKKYGEEFLDNNLCDAYCLARHVQHLREL